MAVITSRSSASSNDFAQPKLRPDIIGPTRVAQKRSRVWGPGAPSMGHVGQDSQMAVSGSPVVAALVRRSKFQDFLSCVPSPRLLSGPTSLTSPHPLVSHMVCGERERRPKNDRSLNRVCSTMRRVIYVRCTRQQSQSDSPTLPQTGLARFACQFVGTHTGHTRRHRTIGGGERIFLHTRSIWWTNSRCGGQRSAMAEVLPVPRALMMLARGSIVVGHTFHAESLDTED